MRTFEIVRQTELMDGERLVGVYLEGARYTCRDDDSSGPLSEALDQWLTDGTAQLIEETEGTNPAQVSGRAEVR